MGSSAADENPGEVKGKDSRRRRLSMTGGASPRVDAALHNSPTRLTRCCAIFFLLRLLGCAGPMGSKVLSQTDDARRRRLSVVVQPKGATEQVAM